MMKLIFLIFLLMLFNLNMHVLSDHKWLFKTSGYYRHGNCYVIISQTLTSMINRVIANYS